jgi:hypothetical protein
MTDYTMPDVQLHQNNFSLLLRKVFTQFSLVESIDISLTIKIGAKIIIGEKRYPIIILKLSAPQRDNRSDKIIKELALTHHIDTRFKEGTLILEIPAIS